MNIYKIDILNSILNKVCLFKVLLQMDKVTLVLNQDIQEILNTKSLWKIKIFNVHTRPFDKHIMQLVELQQMQFFLLNQNQKH